MSRTDEKIKFPKQTNTKEDVRYCYHISRKQHNKKLNKQLRISLMENKKKIAYIYTGLRVRLNNIIFNCIL